MGGPRKLVACADQASESNSTCGESVPVGMEGGLQVKKQGRLCFMFFNICFIADMILLLCNRVDKYLLENL